MPKLLIGVSTLEGIDVAKRVALFYKSSAFVGVSFLLLNGLINRFRNQLEELFYPIEKLMSISVVGILMLIASFFTPAIASVFNVFFVAFVLSLLYFPMARRSNQSVDIDILMGQFSGD